MMKFRMMVILAMALTGALALSQDSPMPSRPWMDRSLPPEQRAAMVVRQMTLDEKILSIYMMHSKALPPREVSGIERLGVPALKISNGPAGAAKGNSWEAQPATALPAALALAASWDLALAEQFGAVAAEEVAARGEHVLEAPGVNIARVPQNGRNFEYFGEDPYLAGQMAVAEIRGIQGQGVIAEVKHFAANNQERDRKTINEVIDERTLREIYLPAFEAAVKQGDVGAVMTAYPSVNGAFCVENSRLLQDVLRAEWGFKGFVQSDRTATQNAVRSARAGLDLAMQPDHYSAEMKAAVIGGQVPESAIDAMVVRRYTQMFRFGMFDRVRPPTSIPPQKNGAIARSIAVQSAVLLKNQGRELPLRKTGLRSIVLIGPYAGAAHTGGLGSSAVAPTYSVSPVDGIRRLVGSGVSVTYTEGGDVSAAAAAARSADVALVMVGNADGEGQDRPDLSLPGNQDALVSAVAAANPHTIVILKTGGAVLMPWIDRVPAVLEVWYPGQEDGNVVADLVFGDANPSGKLPLSFPKAASEVPARTPAQYPGINGTVAYSEKLLVGYRWYDTQNVAPLFPFGHGLSYTTFAFANLSMSPAAADGAAGLAVDVRNTGDRDGAEIVQVYVAQPVAAGEPAKQLRGFVKVALKAGETRRVNVALDPRAFSIWDETKNRWTVFAGQHDVLVGDSSRNLPLRARIVISAAGASRR